MGILVSDMSARLFLSLFLFALYVAVNATGVPMLDAVGFNGGVATARGALTYGAVAMAALLMGVCVEPARGLKTPASPEGFKSSARN